MRKFLLVLFGVQVSLCGWAQEENEDNQLLNDSIVQLSACDTVTDNSFALPFGMAKEVDDLHTDWYLKQYIELDEDCLEGSQNIEYPDSVYKSRLAKLPVIIEMPYNSVVRSHIDMYLHKRRGLIERVLGWETYYMPIFEEALEREGLPLELKYLPIVESALRPDAVSPAGAAGLWQFMPKTGKSMGLEINSLIDERRDPIKSSEMAAKYLKVLYNIYQDWPLAIAAYNCGPGNVNKAIRRTQGSTDYWAIYPYLPSETRGYVPAFIAVNYVMNYYRDHNVCPIRSHTPLLTDTVQIDRRLYLQQVSDVLQISMDELRTLNPQYRRDIIPGDNHPYSLVLPTQQVYAFIDLKDSIYAHDSAKYVRRTEVEPAQKGGGKKGSSGTGEVTYHKVRKGENPTTISRKYGVKLEDLLAWNGLTKKSRLQVGQRLIVKGGKATPNKGSNNSGTKSTKTYKVRKGDSLWSIAKKYGVTEKQIKKANNLKSNNIQPGQVLKIPAK